MHKLTCESARVPKGPDLRVCEADQPDDESVQHVLIIENAVLALKDDVVNKVHKVTLKEKKIHQAIDAAFGKYNQYTCNTLNFFCVGPATISGYSPLSCSLSTKV